jgi:hypothetical protein
VEAKFEHRRKDLFLDRLHHLKPFTDKLVSKNDHVTHCCPLHCVLSEMERHDTRHRDHNTSYQDGYSEIFRCENALLKF